MSRPADPEVADLMALLYQELRDVAGRTLRRQRGTQVQVTSLVHECYERLSSKSADSFVDRAHFLATAGQAMRYILADRVRRRVADKRGGGWTRVVLSDVGTEPETIDLIALDQALSRLETIDPRCARVVSMRLLAGMTLPEVAAACELSLRTVEREWRAGRAFVLAALDLTSPR